MLSGKLLAYVLRHSPESVLLELDEHGRAPFHHVVAALRTTPSELQKVIDEDSKGRFIHSEGMLWAAHGHSVPLTPLAPLYEPKRARLPITARPRASWAPFLSKGSRLAGGSLFTFRGGAKRLQRSARGMEAGSSCSRWISTLSMERAAWCVCLRMVYY